MYTKKDLLIEKERYSYSSFMGKEFLLSFLKSRKNFSAQFSESTSSGIYDSKNELLDHKCLSSDIIYTLDYLKSFLLGNDEKIHPDTGLSLLIKRFEVTKRIYDRVSLTFRALNDSTCDDLNLYIYFSACCGKAYEKTRHLSFLNAMIKCNDILSSQVKKAFQKSNISLLKQVLKEEEFWVLNLMKEKNINVE